MKRTFLSLFIFAFAMVLFLPACDKKTEDTKKTAPNKVKKTAPNKVKKTAPNKVKKTATVKRKPNEIILAVADTAKPFAWIEDGVVKGLQIDIANEIFQKRLAKTVTIKAFPWKRAQEMVKDGSTDFMITAYIGNRQKYSDASREWVTHYEFVPFTQKSNPKLTQLKEIKKLKETKPFKHGNYLGNGWAESNLKDKGYEVDWTPGMELSLKKLVKGRFDLLIDNTMVVRYTAKQMGLWDQIEQLPAKIISLPFFVLISKKSQYGKLLPKVDEAIKAMKKDGTLKKIHDKY